MVESTGSRRFWGICAAIALVAFTLMGLSYCQLVQKYERNSHNADTYVEYENYRKYLQKVIKTCKEYNPRSAAQNEHCKYAEEGIARMASISDLGAQQTMAKATRGILIGTAFQVVVGIAALALLFVTVWQSREASNAAWQVFRQTRDGQRVELQPYLKITRVDDLSVGNTEGIIETLPNGEQRVTHPFTLRADLTIENVGKSPAISVSSVYMHSAQLNSFPESSDTIIEFPSPSNDMWDADGVGGPIREGVTYIMTDANATIPLFITNGVERSKTDDDDDFAEFAEGTILVTDTLTSQDEIRKIRFRLGRDRDQPATIVSDEIINRIT